MTAPADAKDPNISRFRAKLLLAVMLIVTVITIAALYFGQRTTAQAVQDELYRNFQAELTALNNAQELRHAVLVERCRALVRRPRIHAALEDGALDLLYPSARDELRDLMAEANPAADHAGYALHAEFYRFLDRTGAIIRPPPGHHVGSLHPAEENRLALPAAPERQQIGYLVTQTSEGETLLEVLAMPIVSTESGEVIAALVLGFKPPALVFGQTGTTVRRGLWLDGRVFLDGVPDDQQEGLRAEVTRAIAGDPGRVSSVPQTVAGEPHLLFFRRLNPASLYAPAYDISLYSLRPLAERQRELGFQVLGAAALLLLAALLASNLLANRFTRPVERLAVDSAENRAQRVRAEAELEMTHEELQRAARFSADASHQLKTPVTVLRAGLEELMTRENLTPDECHEISALIHQTYRLSGVIEDLLLLSRMDAGRLKIDFKPVDLTYQIETALDDLGAQSDGLDLTIETELGSGLQIDGEKRYLGVVLQNLLENARKYNRPGGRVRIVSGALDGHVVVRVGNTGRPIPVEAQGYIFERFHRGTMGENVPGYGLGLNLARELTRLHRGELRLVRSDDEWTEFEVRFPRSPSEPRRDTSV